MVTSIRHRSRAKEAAQMLFEAILMGELKPGERIDEAKNAKTLQIGRSTLREALQALADSGGAGACSIFSAASSPSPRKSHLPRLSAEWASRAII
jgi:DNA-binding transcriptional MocR family regulator